MNASITENSITYAKTYDDSQGSQRKSSARGVNLQDILTIKHQDAKDNTLNVNTRRHLLRIDREGVDASGGRSSVSAYMVFVITENAIQDDVDSVVATFRDVASNTTEGTNYVSQLLNDES